MPSPDQKRIMEQPVALQHFVPASGRQLRAQSVHRLQVGLFGLCAMLLIVGLANIIMDRAQKPDVNDPIGQVIAADVPEKKPVVDPLADIGVVPSSDPSPTLSAPASPKPTPAPQPEPIDPLDQLEQ